MNRDDFTSRTKRLAADRAGHHCCNPQCRRVTSGPGESNDGSIRLGVAAHITAASKGGPRYNGALPSDERRSLDNAIWLCTECAALIDRDEEGFPVNRLREWKRLGEAAAKAGISGSASFATGSANAVVIAVGFLFRKQSVLAQYPKIQGVNQKVDIVPLHNPNDASVIPNSLLLSIRSEPGLGHLFKILDLSIQNQGTGTADWGAIRVDCQRASIQTIKSIDKGRATVRHTQGGGNSSFAEMLVQRIRPEEKVAIQVYLDLDAAFNVTCQDCNHEKKRPAHLFEVTFGHVSKNVNTKPMGPSDLYPHA